MQLASYLERGPLMWMMMPLPLHVNQKSDYDDMMMMILPAIFTAIAIVKFKYMPKFYTSIILLSNHSKEIG